MIIEILKGLSDISSFICVCILVNLSHKNPLESHYIGNLSKYFYNEVNNALIKRVAIKEKILNGNKKISSIIDNKKLFLRKLVSKSFCSEIHDDFEKYKGTLLSNIFDLNYGKIHKLSIAILVIYCVKIILSLVVGFFLGFGVKNKFALIILSSILILLVLAHYILSIILFYFMEKGDIEKYDDFLDCKNVKVKTFKKITDVNKLRNCFFAFVIMAYVKIVEHKEYVVSQFTV